MPYCTLLHISSLSLRIKLIPDDIWEEHDQTSWNMSFNLMFIYFILFLAKKKKKKNVFLILVIIAIGSDLSSPTPRTETATSVQLNCVTSWLTSVRSWQTRKLMRWFERPTLMAMGRWIMKVSWLSLSHSDSVSQAAFLLKMCISC